MGRPSAAGDVRDWDEEAYRKIILHERELPTKTVFKTAFAPSSSVDQGPEVIVVASSDGFVSPYSVSSCIASAAALPSSRRVLLDNVKEFSSSFMIPSAQPLCINQGHNGPVYDVKFYGDKEDALLLSCGDDGHVRGWRWSDFLSFGSSTSIEGQALNPVLDLMNPQHRGPWESLSPVPENNAIATNVQEGSIFSAAGDACAYCWDVETSKLKMLFKGHKDYLHSIAACNSSNQIITGSEDGAVRIWDCRTGKCTKVIYPEKNHAVKEPSWISCLAVDTSESWLVCGTGKSLSVWSLPSCELVWGIDSSLQMQDVLFHDNHVLAVSSSSVLKRYNINGMVLSQIHCAPQSIFSVSSHCSGVVAVAGYGGLVDVISEFGSHLCTFHC